MFCVFFICRSKKKEGVNMNAHNFLFAKLGLLVVGGGVFTFVIQQLGGWDYPAQALVTLSVADYFTGIIVAGIFKNSSKTTSGGFESRASLKGLFRKGMILVIVCIAAKLDLMMDINNFVRDAIIYAFCANELLSIIENARAMGIPIPAAFTQVMSMLNRKAKLPDNFQNEESQNKNKEENLNE